MKAAAAEPDLPDATQEVIMRLARALARQAAREDHENEQASNARRDLRQILR